MPILNRINRLFANKNLPLLLALAAVLAYFLCLPNQMFWDDDDFILKNMYIRDWQFWPKFFTSNVIAGAHLVSNYWRPLLQIVFAAEWHLWADWVYGWHAVSIACHAGAGILLFKVLDALLDNRTAAILIALLWIVHPVHTEAVVYPNSLGDPLAALFILGGLYAWILFRKSSQNPGTCAFWWAALLAYPLALLSKETGILLVALIALTDFFFLTPQKPLPQKIKHIALALWPFVLIAAGYLLLRGSVLNFNNSFNFYNASTPLAANLDMRLWTFLRAITLYAGFIFFPYELRVERLITPADSFWIPDVILGGALCAGLVGLSIYYWKRKPAIAFGALWFFIAILPASNLVVLINALVYEHFLYNALIGILIIVVTLALDAAGNAKTRRIVISIAVGIVLVFCVRSAWRCLDWRTAIGFYEQLIPHVPQSYRVANNLGMAYADKGLLDKALTTYSKAVAIDPDNAVAYHNIANIYRDQGRKELARINYEKAIALQSSFIFSYKSLAQIYLDRGEFLQARQVLERYFTLTDEKPYIIGMLTQIALREGALEDAARYLRIWLKLQPGEPQATALMQQLSDIQSNSARTSASVRTPVITGAKP